MHVICKRIENIQSEIICVIIFSFLNFIYKNINLHKNRQSTRGIVKFNWNVITVFLLQISAFLTL